MMARWFKKILLIPGGWFAVLVLLASCGSGGSVADGGIGGTGVISAGSITAKGSIFVNGVEYATGGAVFERDEDAPVTIGTDDSALKLGMIVSVDGSLDPGRTAGTATRIKFEDNLEGPIGQVSVVTPGLVKTLEVLGQVVVVENGVTRFDDSVPDFGFGTIVTGSSPVVEVSGFARPDGSIQATYMKKTAEDLESFLLAADARLEVMGTVDGLSTATFRINALTVDFSAAAPRGLENSPGGVFENGLTVEVKGVDYDPLTSTLIATDVEVKKAGLGVETADQAEVEGFISSFSAASSSFVVNGQAVSFASARIEGGLATDLANGVKVEVEGRIDGGILQAEKVEFAESVKIEANVSAVDVPGGTITLQGFVPALIVAVDTELTEFEEGGDLTQVTEGSSLKIRGRLTSDTTMTLLATRIEVIGPAPDTEVSLQGPVEAVDSATGLVTVVGIGIDTSTIGDNEFRDGETSVGRDSFLAALTSGDLVKARAELNLNTQQLTWNQIEMDD